MPHPALLNWRHICAGLSAGVLMVSATAGTAPDNPPGAKVDAAPSLALAASDPTTEADYFNSLPVVLTVTRLAQPLSETPGAVTLIDRKTIEALQVRDMTELLRLVPGYLISGYNGANPIAVYHAPLDEFGSRNLLLIDGRPAYSSYYFGGTSRGLMSIDPEEVERVEVLRGANSAAYGANALFGVINIVTRHSIDTLGEQVTLRAGGGHIRDARVAISRGDATLSYRLSAARRADDGLPGLFDDRQLNQLRFRLDARPRAADELQLEAGLSDLKAGDGYAGDVDNPQRLVAWRDWYLNGQWRRQLSDTEQLKVSLSATRETLRDRYDYTPAPGLAVDFSGVGERLDLEAQHQWTLSPQWRLVWGAGHRQESARSRPLFNTDEALSFGETRLFGNLEWQPGDRWTVNTGLFVARHGRTGTFATPRLMVNHQLAPDHTLRAGINQSVRQPSLFELAGDVRYELNGQLVGRTYAATGTVGPERLLSHELGYFGNWRDWRATIDVRLFRERMDDYIRRVVYRLPESLPFTGTRAYDYANDGGPRLRGLEYQWRWSPTTHTEWWINQSFARTTWPDGGQSTRTPRSVTTVAWFQRWPDQWRTGLIWSSRGRMHWNGVGNSPSDLRQLDLYLSRAFQVGRTRGSLSLTVRNLDGSDVLFESRFARPVSRRQAYATLHLAY